MLVIRSFQKPFSIKTIANQAIQSDDSFSLHRNVPFITRPALLLPPVSGRAPWSSGPENFSLHCFIFGVVDVRRPAVLHGDCDVDRRTEDTQRSHEVVTTETPSGYAQGRLRRRGIHRSLMVDFLCASVVKTFRARNAACGILRDGACPAVPTIPLCLPRRCQQSWPA